MTTTVFTSGEGTPGNGTRVRVSCPDGLPLGQGPGCAVGRGGDGAATWTVSPARTKAKLEHRVTLSDRAMAVPDEARETADEGGLVFPSPTGRVLSDSTLSKLLRELGIGARTARLPLQLPRLGSRGLLRPFARI